MSRHKNPLMYGRYEQTSMWGDDSTAFIVAIDFDGTITKRRDSLMSYEYGKREPHRLDLECSVRPEMKRFIKFIKMIGAVPFIFTSRCNSQLVYDMVQKLQDAGIEREEYDLYVGQYWNLSMEGDVSLYKPVYHILFDDVNAGVPILRSGQSVDALFHNWFEAGLNDLFLNRLCLNDGRWVTVFNSWILHNDTVFGEDEFKALVNNVKEYLEAIYNGKRR